MHKRVRVLLEQDLGGLGPRHMGNGRIDGIDSFIRKWQLPTEQALSMDKKIDEDMKFDLILDALSNLWDNFVTTHAKDVT